LILSFKSRKPCLLGSIAKKRFSTAFLAHFYANPKNVGAPDGETKIIYSFVIPGRFRP
jgi:hypothetical protein